MLPFFSRGLNPRTPTPAANASPSDGVPMDDMPRLSTETQRRNGFRQSHANDRSARIIEDLQNGVYQCSICVSMIHGVGNPDSIWACRTCHTVFHFRCAKDWATSSRTFGSTSWKCPHCQAYQDGSISALCWCGKQSYGLISALGTTAIPNACRNECQRRGNCSHGTPSICGKDCHPGPCEFLCADTCTGPPQPPQTPTCLEKMGQRFHYRPNQSLPILVTSSTFLAVAYILWGILFHLHTEWWTKPYKYPGWAKSKGSNVDVGIFFGRKALTKFFGLPGLIIFGVGLWSLPIIGFAGGVDIAWYYQMKDSCNGFDVRVKMDKPGSAATDDSPTVRPKPTSRFTLRSPLTKDQDFHLGSHMRPITNSTEPFQYFHRLSGNTFATPHVAVDIDFENHLWRRMILNDTDIANAWIAFDSYIASGSKGHRYLPSLPKFRPIEEKLSGEGSFTNTSETNPHLRINDLDLSIAYMDRFFNDCHQEPFLRVFDTSGLSETEGRKMLDAMWDNKPNDRIVMRTASFGHGRQELSMCLKEGEVIESIQDITDAENKGVIGSIRQIQGIQDEMLVPFAIIAATRMRVKEAGIRRTWCSAKE